MATFLLKYLFKNKLPNDLLKIGSDPYFDEDQVSRKKFKAIPAGLSERDAKILKKMRRRAYRLDCSISCICCSFKIGWAAIIGIIPVIGDIIDAVLATRLVNLAKEAEIPDSVIAAMYANVMVDFGLGLIPVVGDIADMIYKANTRNLQLLEKVLLKRLALQIGTSAGSDGLPQGVVTSPPVTQHMVSPALNTGAVSSYGATTTGVPVQQGR